MTYVPHPPATLRPPGATADRREGGNVVPSRLGSPPDVRAKATETALRQELASTRRLLESVIEQLAVTEAELLVANGEIASKTGELQSMNIMRRRKAEREIGACAYQERLQHMAFDAALTEERERRRLSVVLHDGIGQDLALAKMKLAPLCDALAGPARDAVGGALALIEKAIGESRTLVFELSPPVLYDLGLKDAVSWLAEDVGKRHGVRIEVTDDGADKPLDEAARAIVFRSVRELLMNVLKHAKATSARVSLRRCGDDLDLEVGDCGVGFDPGGPTGPGFGLLSVDEQITRIGGRLTVESAPDKGTVVSLRVPLRASIAPDESRTDWPLPAGNESP